MAELAYALGLGSSTERFVGSSPTVRTTPCLPCRAIVAWRGRAGCCPWGVLVAPATAGREPREAHRGGGRLRHPPAHALRRRCHPARPRPCARRAGGGIALTRPAYSLAFLTTKVTWL